MEFITPQINWPLIIICLSFSTLDIITGFVQAIINKCVSSEEMRKGLLHKLGFVLAIVFGCLCEYASLYTNLEFAIPVQGFVCGFIILIEMASNLENLVQINPELANKKFMNFFRQVNDNGNDA